MIKSLTVIKASGFALNLAIVYFLLPNVMGIDEILVMYAKILFLSSFINVGLGNLVLNDEFDDRLYLLIFILLLAVLLFSKDLVWNLSILCGVTTGTSQLLRRTSAIKLALIINVVTPHALLLTLVFGWDVRYFAMSSAVVLGYYLATRSHQPTLKFISLKLLLVSVLENCKDRVPLLIVANDEKLLFLQLLPIFTVANFLNNVKSWGIMKLQPNELFPKFYGSTQQGLEIIIIALSLIAYVSQNLLLTYFLITVLCVYEFKSGPKKSYFIRANRLAELLAAQTLVVLYLSYFYFFDQVATVLSVLIIARFGYVFTLNRIKLRC